MELLQQTAGIDDAEPDAAQRRVAKLQSMQFALFDLLDTVFDIRMETLGIDGFILWLAKLFEKSGATQSVRSNKKHDQSKDYAAVRKLQTTLKAIKKSLTIVGKTETDFEELLSIFDEAVRGQRYRFAFLPKDSVQVMTPFDVRGRSYRTVFIAGLNEGEFPAPPSLSLINEKEKRKINDLSHQAILQDERSLQESAELDFIVSACVAVERLYLCRTSVDESGKDILPSVFVQTLKKNLKKDGIAIHSIPKKTSPDQKYSPLYL